MQFIIHHESANQTHGKRFDSRGRCPTFTGLKTPLDMLLCTKKVIEIMPIFDRVIPKNQT